MTTTNPTEILNPYTEMDHLMFQVVISLEALKPYNFPLELPTAIKAMSPPTLKAFWQTVLLAWLDLPEEVQKLIRLPFPIEGKFAQSCLAFDTNRIN